MINTRLLLLKRGMDQWKLEATMAQLPKVYNVFKGVSVIGQVHKGPLGSCGSTLSWEHKIYH